jgi:HEAT repeat protein
MDGPCQNAIRLMYTEENLSPEAVAACLRSRERLQPQFDEKIASYLEQFGSVLSADATIKLLEILGRISDCSRVQLTLLRLSGSPDPRVQSKAAILLGRGTLNVKLIEVQLMSPDARVRANAIESAWSVKDLKMVLRNATMDPDNRVVGNALLALYNLGDADVFDDLIKMAHHESEAFRVTAIWVMGKTEDARFGDTLRSFVQTAKGKVRWMALRSLGQLKRASGVGELRNSQQPVPVSGGSS